MARLTKLLTALVAMALVMASCGLSVDETARVIPIQDLPAGLQPGQLPTPTPVVPQGSDIGPGSEQIHMLRGNRLVTVQRPIADTPERLMQLLLSGTFPEEVAQGIETALSRGTRIQNIEVNELFDLAIVDLAPGSLNSQNAEQRLAFAQIVYTLTSLPEIKEVQFIQSDPSDPSAEPVPLAVQRDTGSTTPGFRVGRDSFSRLAPQDENEVARPAFDIPIATPTPTPDPDAPPTYDQPIWMLDDNNRLVEVIRDLERSGEALLVSLLAGPLADERERNIRSAIPPDALASSVEVSNFEVSDFDEQNFETRKRANIAFVDLDSGSLPALENRQERFLAGAQIVFTLTDLEEIDQVVFSLNGEPIPMPVDGATGFGQSLPFDIEVPSGLDRSNYLSALAPTDPALQPLQPTPTPTPSPTPEP